MKNPATYRGYFEDLTSKNYISAYDAYKANVWFVIKVEIQVEPEFEITFTPLDEQNFKQLRINKWKLLSAYEKRFKCYGKIAAPDGEVKSIQGFPHKFNSKCSRFEAIILELIECSKHDDWDNYEKKVFNRKTPTEQIENLRMKLKEMEKLTKKLNIEIQDIHKLLDDVKIII